MNKEGYVTIPLVARMRKNEISGEFEMVRELSVFADVSADAVARFILDGLHMQFERRPIEEAIS